MQTKCNFDYWVTDILCICTLKETKKCPVVDIVNIVMYVSYIIISNNMDRIFTARKRVLPVRKKKQKTHKSQDGYYFKEDH